MPRKFIGKYLHSDHPIYDRLKLRLERRTKRIFGLPVTYLPPVPEAEEISRYTVKSQTSEASSSNKGQKYSRNAIQDEMRGIENVINKRSYTPTDLDRIGHYESDSDKKEQLQHHDAISYSPECSYKSRETCSRDDEIFMQDESMRNVSYKQDYFLTKDSQNNSQKSVTYMLDNVTDLPENITYKQDHLNNMEDHVTVVPDNPIENDTEKNLPYILNIEMNKQPYKNLVTTMFSKCDRQESLNVGNVSCAEDVNPEGHINAESGGSRQGHRNLVRTMFTGNNESYVEDTANVQDISEAQDNLFEQQDNAGHLKPNENLGSQKSEENKSKKDKNDQNQHSRTFTITVKTNSITKLHIEINHEEQHK